MSVSDRDRLVRLLQAAHAGELAAALAYRGHWRSLKNAAEIAEVQQIERDEWHHREQLAGMLDSLQSGPDPRLETKLRRIGSAIAFLCRLGGWLIPMYGAGRLESGNVREYEDGARLAHRCGRPDWVEPFLAMAELEWEHESYFRGKVESHWLGGLLPRWTPPPPKASIRAGFEAFRRSSPDRSDRYDRSDRSDRSMLGDLPPSGVT